MKAHIINHFDMTEPYGKFKMNEDGANSFDSFHPNELFVVLTPATYLKGKFK